MKRLLAKNESLVEELYWNIHQDIIDKCKEKDREAQFHLYKLYSKSMYNTCLRITGNTAEAEDIIQEAFLSAFNKLDSYNGKVSFGSWLKKIVINKSLDSIKKKKRIVFETVQDDYIEDETTENETKISAQHLKYALSELQENYKIIFSLYYLEGYDHDEIAEILKISTGASRVQLLRAKNKLKIIISDIWKTNGDI